MKQKITESLTTNDILAGQFITKPKALAQTNGYSISFVNENSRLARRIKAVKTNGKKYKHITI